ALDELHQLLVDGRSGQVRDVGIDSAGVLTGVLAAAGMIRLMANRKRNHSREPV
ncbi:MAG: VanZ family protein, partial [Clostridia bacterium]|nr:VanZ family protein [Clostridia bacterium]